MRGGAAEGGDVGFDESGVVGGFSALAAVEVQGNLDVSADESLLQFTAKLHFEGFGSAGEAHVQVEKAMIDAFEAEGEAEGFGNTARDAGESGHGVNGRGLRGRRGHASTFPSSAGSKESMSATSMNWRR